MIDEELEEIILDNLDTRKEIDLTPELSFLVLDEINKINEELENDEEEADD